MKDRIPTKPGRVQLVPSPDDDDLFILSRADEPTQAGTPLNKASLLSDSVAAEFGLTGDAATVNGALGVVAQNYTRVRTGAAIPDSTVAAKRGDLYVQDGGGTRHVYVCNAVGERETDLGAVWERGSVDGNGVNAASTSRIRSDVIHIPAGTKFVIASGFRLTFRFFSEAREYQSSVTNRTGTYTVDAESWARLLILRVTEDTSEVADIDEFAAAVTTFINGTHWTALSEAREVRKTAVFTASDYWTVPGDLRGTITVMCFGGGSGGQSPLNSTAPDYTGYGGCGGHMATWTGVPDAKRYEITVGRGGIAGSSGGDTSFGSLCTASGGSARSGGSGGGGGNQTGAVAAAKSGGSGSYGGGGGSYSGVGGSGGTYGGGGGGGFGSAGGTGRGGTYAGGAGSASYGGGGGGWKAAGKAATSSTGGAGGAGQNTLGFGLPFEGTGAAGTVSGGGGGYGGSGGNGLKTGALSTGGGGGGYGASGGAAGTASGGGGGGYGGRGGNGEGTAGGGGGGYGLSGAGGDAKKRSDGIPINGDGGIAAGGSAGCRGGDGVVVIYYTGIEVV